MPRPWRYDGVLARFVPDPLAPAPRPKKLIGSRANWLEREKRRAADHVLARLKLAKASGPIPDGVDPARVLAILERAIGGDIKDSIDRRRAQYAKIDALARAADALLAECVSVRGDNDDTVPQFVFGARRVSEIEIDEAWRKLSPATRAPLPSVRSWRDIRRLFEDHALDTQLRTVDLLARTAVMSDAANSLLSAWDAPDDPRHVSFMHAVRCADPIGERFASECLGYGLRPVEAAMIDAIATASPRARAAMDRGASWFDRPDIAQRRWRDAYERLFIRCGIAAAAGRRSTSVARDQSG